MKKICIVLVVLSGLICSGRVSAQRCLCGQKGLQLTVGTVDGFVFRDPYRAHRIYGGLAFSRYNGNKTRWVIGMEYLQKDYRYGSALIPLAQFTADAGYYVPIFSDRGKNVVLSVGFSVLAGYETSN